MNQLVVIIILAAGGLLIYSAVRDERPADVVRRVFGNA